MPASVWFALLVLLPILACWGQQCDGPTGNCEDEGSPAMSPRLVIAVLSAPANRERRAALRATWMRMLPNDIVARFFVASSSTVVDGAELGSDVIQLSKEQFPLADEYRHLPEKTRAVFRASLGLFPGFQYLFKTDDDVLLRPQMLLALLDALERDGDTGSSRRPLYAGHFHRSAFVVRHPNAKFFEPNQMDCKQHLPYASGAGYALSRSLVEYLAVPPVTLRPFRLEDVAVGFWLAPLDVRRVDLGFMIRPERDPSLPGGLCPTDTVLAFPAPPTATATGGGGAIETFVLPDSDSVFILQHRLTPSEMIACWKEIESLN